MDKKFRAQIARNLREVKRLDERIPQLQTAAKQLQTAAEQARRRLALARRNDRRDWLIDLGGLIVIAALLGAEQQVVLGALIRAKELANDQARVAIWRRNGQAAFDVWRKTGKNETRPNIQSTATNESPATIFRKFTQRLIAWGAIIDKAGIAGWDRAVILGVLLAIAPRLNDPERVKSWTDTAQQAAASSLAAGPAFPLVRVTFAGRIPKQITADLRSLGLALKRKDKGKRRYFIGRVDPTAADRIAAPAGGEVWVGSRKVQG